MANAPNTDLSNPIVSLLGICGKRQSHRDACSNVLVKGCYMSVNDDAIALKGGKGPTADKDANNGANFNIIIEDCEYGLCYSALTCGSESIHDRNIILRRCKVEGASHVLWLKMRPDTPQLYEYVTVEHITGQAHSLLFIRPWTVWTLNN